MEYPEFLHPANAEELVSIAEETGAEVLRGALRYPSESGGWQLGDVDLGEHLEKYRDRDVVVIIAPVGEAEAKQVVCGICGFVLNEVGECPRCKLITEEAAKELKAQREAQEALFHEIEEILEQAGD
jgi:hypothetical protein